MALLDAYRAAIVKIVQPEARAAVRLHAEITASNAEKIAVCGVHVENGATLAQDQTGDVCSIIEGEIVELHQCVGAEKSHGAILKLDLGPAVIVRGHGI